MYCATYVLCNSGAQKFSRNIISGAAVPNSAVWTKCHSEVSEIVLVSLSK